MQISNSAGLHLQDEEVRINGLVASLHEISEKSVQQQQQQHQQQACFCAIIYARKRKTTEVLARALSSKVGLIFSKTVLSPLPPHYEYYCSAVASEGRGKCTDSPSWHY